MTKHTFQQKLSSIHRNKGTQFKEYLLGKLHTAHYVQTDNMCTHLLNMNTFRERLGEIGSPISDVQFNAYIRTFLSLTTCFQPLLTTLSTTARQTKTALSSDDLVWHLVEEANTIKLEASVNKAHAALAAVHNKMCKISSDGSKGKEKKGKDKKSATPCPNCKIKEHTKNNCFAKGGGKKHKAPE